MRYAVISDIHSNLEAFEEALKELKRARIDKYVCAGDIVGYGADPRACIKKIRSLNIPTVLGNHDAVCSGAFDIGNFNDHARDALIWTKAKLSPSDTEYLKTLKIIIETEDFTVVHGSLDEPEKFNYIMDNEGAARSFGAIKKNILFVGHSHAPGIFEFNGKKIKYFYKERTKALKNAKYIVNAGSVGQPRDGDPRGSYVIYDTESEEFFIKRFKYDIGRAQRKILDAGLPEKEAYRLTVGE